MILNETCYVNSERNMVSETLQNTRLMDGKAENNLHDQNDQILLEGFNGQHENVGLDGINATPCSDENCREENTSGTSSRDMADNLNGSMLPDIISKRVRQQKEMTLEDMYNDQYDYDDDDDSDWEPLPGPTAVIRWFCVNCTMANQDDVVHCDICGEHKESGILKHGFFASPFSQEAGLIHTDSEVVERGKDSRSPNLTSNNSTAVGFDERMLLHSEVEMKSHPHPERPDRLRAIAASLATAGIFPGKCYPILAREITREELQMDVHHGNGTQEIFEQNKSVLYISLHRHEGGNFYPGTGASHEVGSMGAEGYCVNIPWSRGGVGDNDYIFAFQHVVLPIASEFAPDFTIISAGFDAARGDPLGCCDVTPAGFAKMTDMLNVLSGGKLLVILEGGYNLRSISSSATAVIKVLLGETPGCELDNCLPSKSGLRTVLEVLKIQMNFWPTLASTLTKLESEWGSCLVENRKKHTKKRRRAVAPKPWKWGRKTLLYHLLSGHLRYKSKRI